MYFRERESHARCVYPTQYVYLAHVNSKGEAREEETNTRIMKESSKKFGRKERVHEGENSQSRNY